MFASIYCWMCCAITTSWIFYLDSCANVHWENVCIKQAKKASHFIIVIHAKNICLPQRNMRSYRKCHKVLFQSCWCYNHCWHSEMLLGTLRCLRSYMPPILLAPLRLQLLSYCSHSCAAPLSLPHIFYALLALFHYLSRFSKIFDYRLSTLLSAAGDAGWAGCASTASNKYPVIFL